MKEHPSPSLPPASTPPPPTTKGPERSTSRSSSFVEVRPRRRRASFRASSPHSPPSPFLQELARSCSFFQLRRARLSVSLRGAFPWQSSASTEAPRTPRSAPLPHPLPCGRCPSRSSSTSPAIGRGPPRPPIILCVILYFVRGALLQLPVRGGHRPRHHRRPP